MFKDKEQCLFSESSKTMCSSIHIGKVVDGTDRAVVAGSGTVRIKGSRRFGDLCLAMCGNL